MLFKKLHKRQEAATPNAGADPVTPEATPANPPELILKERRRFSRPMPVPDVQEQDWDVWLGVTQEKTSDKPGP